MDWIHHYQLFLFDFDGILVNTETLHYQAYLKMCSDRGFFLDWDERTYVRHAMYSATGLKEAVYREFPELHRYEPCWDILYKEKKQAYYTLLQERGASLIPGIDVLLRVLEKAGIKRCVVTHSPLEQIELIRKQNPILDTIPQWLTREDYSQPKPSPECYQKAVELFKAPGDRVIGFEDSPRGLKALLGVDGIDSFLVSNYFDQPEIEQLSKGVVRSFKHFPSFPSFFKEMELVSNCVG